MGAFANPFDPDKLLWNGCPCGQHRSIIEHNMAMAAAQGKDASRFSVKTWTARRPLRLPLPGTAPPIASIRPARKLLAFPCVSPPKRVVRAI